MRDVKNAALFALRERMIVYLDRQVWIARLQEKKREEKNDTSYNRCRATLQRCEHHAHSSRDNVTFPPWRADARASGCNIVTLSLLWIFSFIWTFLPTRSMGCDNCSHHLQTSFKRPRKCICNDKDDNRAIYIPHTPRL